MPEAPKRIQWDSPKSWRLVWGSQYEPHWAIKLLHDPRGEDWDKLVKSGEYPEIGRIPDEPVTPEIALGPIFPF